MRYSVQSGKGELATFQVLVSTPGEALKVAHDLAGRAVLVRIVDETGRVSAIGDFSRTHCGYSLSPEQMDLIRGTCDVLMKDDVAAADLFYTKLFELAPGVRRLFSDDLSTQRRKLQDTLVALVEQVIGLKRVTEVVQGLGQRHISYGAKPEHYAPVGEALLHSLACLLGPRFTPAVQDAWTALYLDVAAAMTAPLTEVSSVVGPAGVSASR